MWTIPYALTSIHTLQLHVGMKEKVVKVKMALATNSIATLTRNMWHTI
jgi:hypothetical protein